MGEAYENGEPVSSPGLPEIPECSVVRREDGLLQITHKATGRTATARDDEEDPVVQGAILRCLASYRWVTPTREIPFWTGYPA
ncbi:hypothetical protein [Nonomuraea sp. NPDC049400]|uniref:hypothetical protein n=1 Tax=Nonomuraea sp. NPDC049400 TaxID=3364352 RepID=UPI0037949B20